MAGAGYKLFNTGDVLTAAQVNTYLQEQTVMVFASSTARTTALSGVLAEGMVSYLQDTNAVEVYNGSAWVGVSGAGDITEVQAGTGISITSGTGPIPVVTNTMATAIDAAGDLIYGTAADTFARLGIGTAGQVLKVNSGATAPEWGAAAAGGANWSLLNAGGTALTGAATVTVSGISGADKVMVLVKNASSGSASAQLRFRFNTDTGSNYYNFGQWQTFTTTYSSGGFENLGGGAQTSITFARMSDNDTSVCDGVVLLTGCNASGVKVFQCHGGSTPASGSGQIHTVGGGYYDSASTISSISVVASSGSLDGGTVYVYTSA